MSAKPTSNSMLLVAKHLKDIEQAVTTTGDHTHPSERTKFSFFLRLALWAQKVRKEPCDSIAQLDEFIGDLSENLLCDNQSELWFKVQEIKNQVRSGNSDEPIYLDFFTNSNGFEAFLDLCLIHFMTLMLCPVSLGSSGVKFRIYNQTNVNQLLKQMAQSEQDNTLQDLAATWRSHVESDFWQLQSEVIELPTVDEDLYKRLSASKLIMFKGEMYYRKLVGDQKWHPLTPFRSTLKNFQPGPMVAIRAIRSDIVAGIEDISIFSRINNNELPRDWITSGDYGLVQYFDPTR